MTEKVHLFDNPKNVKRLLTGFYICCGILTALDFVVHRHSAMPLDTIPGFYALYGLISCVVLVVLAKEMRKLVMRDEDYYSDAQDKKEHQDV